MLEEAKFEESKLFSSNHIEKFIEKGDTQDIRADKEFDAFRYLMNENISLTFHQDQYMISTRKVFKSE
jgi:hypothetical protein